MDGIIYQKYMGISFSTPTIRERTASKFYHRVADCLILPPKKNRSHLMTCKLYHVFVDAPLETLSPNQGKMGCTPNSVAMAFIVFIYIAMYIQLSPDQMSQCWILCGNHLVYRRQPANLLKQICPEWFPALKSYRKLQLKNPIFFGHPKPNPTTPQAFGRV